MSNGKPHKLNVGDNHERKCGVTIAIPDRLFQSGHVAPVDPHRRSLIAAQAAEVFFSESHSACRQRDQ
jgi:hypothetical protein